MKQTPVSYRSHFSRSADSRLQDHLRREGQLRRDKENRQDRIDDDMSDLASAVVLATDTQIAEFTVELDAYDEATVKALLENEEQLDLAREKVQALLSRAHTLPDGRRVFKTEDGVKVFDEFGTELDAAIIDPAEISDALPRWETMVEAREGVERLESERTDILEFQQRVDDARDRLGEDDLSEDELADLGAALEGEMPDAVKRQMPGYEPTQTPDLAQGFANAARPPVAEPLTGPSTQPQF